MKSLVFIALFLSIGFNALPASGDQAFEYYQNANQAYDASNYVDAIKLYQQAIKDGFRPGASYYNLANAYFRDQQLGNAIANYRIAAKITPRDLDINENLKMARDQTADGITKTEMPKPVKTFLFIYYYLGIDEIIWLAAFLVISISIFGIIKLYLNNSFLKTIIKINFVLLLIISATIGAHLYFNNFKPDAVINCEQASVHSGPGESYQEMFILHDGSEMDVIGQDNEWRKIQINVDGKKQRGWVETNKIVEI